MSSYPLIVTYQWFCICSYLHQRCFKGNATGTIWPAHMPSSVGVVIKSLLLPGPHWETHGTNTQRSSHLCVIEKQWAAQSLIDDSVFEKSHFCWHSLETLNSIYKEATFTQIFHWLKKMYQHYSFDNIFHERHLFVTEYLKWPLLYPLFYLEFPL